MLCEKNEQLEACRIKLYAFFKNKEYGSRVSWEEINKVIETEAEGLNISQVRSVVAGVNKMLFADQKYLDSIHGFGKKVLNPNEHSLTSRKQIRSASKKYRKAGNILARANLEMLNEDERKEVQEDSNKWRTLELFSKELSKKKKVVQNKDRMKSTNSVLELIKLFKS